MTFALENKLLTACHVFSPWAAATLWELQGQIQPQGKNKCHTFLQNDKKNKIYTLSNKFSRLNRQLQLRLCLRLPNKTCSKIVKMLNWTLRAGSLQSITVWHYGQTVALTGRPLSPSPGNPGSPFGPGFPCRATVLPMSAGSTGHTSHGSPWRLNTSQTRNMWMRESIQACRLRDQRQCLWVPSLL